MSTNNLILLADAYKYSHHKLYYPGTQKVYSYLESRGGKFDNTVFYGLQYFLKNFLEGQAFTQADLDEAEPILNAVFGRNDVFNKSKFQYILDKHNGRLPVRIKAVPEGKAIPVKNVLMTIENTDPECYWLPNFLETLLMQIWYPSTVATLSREIKKVISQYYEETASDGTEAGIPLVLNDFGFRGASSIESAGIGGSAHLINFDGSDTIYASLFAQKYYKTKQVFGKSIPATEHSIVTLLGEKGEKEVFQHVLEEFPSGVVACVSDSYDIFRAYKEYWGTEFKDRILERNGMLVIRPDSGDPVQTLLKVFEILFQQFGFTQNEKGYKVLPPQVRVIQGDGVNYEAIQEIYTALKQQKISAENLVLGMGGALLQKLDRDTQKYALKCSYAEINGKPVLVQKRPKELNSKGELIESFKTSKAGKLKLVQLNNSYQTVSHNEYPEISDELITVFENGKILKEYSFEEIRENAAIETEML
ncbi:nicotinate phosphoribosyltransferase [Marivirga lumbricoides]|uniref:Nicotinamide phosphoribosyltransferase n=1 Tax=Marivirga lumbricoides TaxID=1046115 RepID=A0A2T4DW61_9BACT|nr:nicotinate phosphoribosyltransferase [Marivirga lumbricoides]